MLIRVNKVNVVIHPILSTNSETAKQFFEQKYQGGAASQSKVHHSRVSSSGGSDLFLLHDDRLLLSRALRHSSLADEFLLQDKFEVL